MPFIVYDINKKKYVTKVDSQNKHLVDCVYWFYYMQNKLKTAFEQIYDIVPHVVCTQCVFQTKDQCLMLEYVMGLKKQSKNTFT